MFLREPLSIFKGRFIQIAQVNSPAAGESGISVEMMDKKTQITIYNSDKMYNLLQTVIQKQELRAKPKTAPKVDQMVFGQLCGRK